MTATRALPSALLALGFAAAAAGCSDEDPCQDYVDYICDCHPDDPELPCEELQNTYADADDKLQDQCVTALEDQESADDDAGHECGDAPADGTGA